MLHAFSQTVQKLCLVSDSVFSAGTFLLHAFRPMPIQPFFDHRFRPPLLQVIVLNLINTGNAFEMVSIGVHVF